MKQRKMKSAYKNKHLKDIALASYSTILSEWPVPYEEKRVDTSFGETTVLESGLKDGIPLIMLHGGGGNSTMWQFNIAELSKNFRVFLVDIVGEAGRSADEHLSFKTDAYSEWLKELIQKLSLKKPNICGASLGGMLGLNFGLKYPKDVSSLVLLAPPNLLKMNFSFIFLAMCAFILPFKFFKKYFLKYMSLAGSSFSDRDTESFIKQVSAYQPSSEAIPVLTEEDLAKLSVKTLILFGENEVLYNPKKAIEKIQKANKSIDTYVIKDAKHTISIDAPNVFLKVINNFCKKVE